MADILIRGMEMPKDWDLWRCIDTGGTVYNVKPVITGTAQEVGTAISLPEWHGRLGDLDELMNNIGDVPYKGAVRRVLMSAPTIVPAEGGTENGNC